MTSTSTSRVELVRKVATSSTQPYKAGAADWVLAQHLAGITSRADASNEVKSMLERTILHRCCQDGSVNELTQQPEATLRDPTDLLITNLTRSRMFIGASCGNAGWGSLVSEADLVDLRAMDTAEDVIYSAICATRLVSGSESSESHEMHYPNNSS